MGRNIGTQSYQRGQVYQRAGPGVGAGEAGRKGLQDSRSLGFEIRDMEATVGCEWSRGEAAWRYTVVCERLGFLES